MQTEAKTKQVHRLWINANYEPCTYTKQAVSSIEIITIAVNYNYVPYMIHSLFRETIITRVLRGSLESQK